MFQVALLGGHQAVLASDQWFDLETLQLIKTKVAIKSS
jgi:hypothetical protein